jgi:transcriptional regulator with XRE-family HTH domain
MSTWASRIRELQKVDLTLAEIGDLIGLSTGAVSDIANGHSASPRGEAALKLHDLHKRRCSRKNGTDSVGSAR